MGAAEQFRLYCLHACGLISIEYANLINTIFLFQTPAIVIMASMILVCAFTVRGGIEIIGRCAVLFAPLYLFPLLLFFSVATFKYHQYPPSYGIWVIAID